MKADEAKSVGLVNDVYSDKDSLFDGVMEIAEEMASKSPLAIWGSKEMITYSRAHSTADSLNYIATWQSGMFQPADMKEAFSSKAENRPSEFDDLLPMREGLDEGI